MILNGSITALATPFEPGGAVDFRAWDALLARQVDGGTQAVVVAGSTGEAATLSDDEYGALIRAAATRAGDRVAVLAGSGVSGTQKTIAQTRLAREHGAQCALVVTPPYVRATQEGLRRHYLEVAEHGGLPIVLYNVPGRTGCDLLPATVARLASHERIVAIKEAVAESSRMQELLALKSGTFQVLSGDDPTACRALLAGADGVISVASNAIPATFRALVDLARAARTREADALDAQLQPLYALLGAEPNPIPVKALLAALHLCHDALRLPLLPMSAAARAPLAPVAAQVVALESAHRALAA